MVVYFVRHGGVENPRGEKYGRRPGFPLSFEGKVEAERTAGQLADRGIKVIFSSPLQRTQETAQIIQRVLAVPLIFDNRLLEYDDGQYTGLGRLDWEYVKSWSVGWDSLDGAGQRILDFLKEIKEQGRYSVICVVSHETPMAVARAQMLGKPSAEYANYCLPAAGVQKMEF